MLNAYERRLALFYLANMLRRLRRTMSEATKLAEWLEENASLIASDARSTKRMKMAASTTPLPIRSWRALRNHIEKESVAAANISPDQMGCRLRRLGETVGLSSLDIALLEVLLRYRTQPVIESLIDAPFLYTHTSLGPMNARRRGAAVRPWQIDQHCAKPLRRRWPPGP